jgi:hypothetical protein
MLPLTPPLLLPYDDGWIPNDYPKLYLAIHPFTVPSSWMEISLGLPFGKASSSFKTIILCISRKNSDVGPAATITLPPPPSTYRAIILFAYFSQSTKSTDTEYMTIAPSPLSATPFPSR